MQIRSLGYLGLQAPDPKGWLDFATRVLGLMPARVLPGERYLGLEVAGPAELDEAVEALGHRGVDVACATPEELEARAVHGMAHLRDPSGNRVELFHGVTRDHKFASPAGVPRFVTGPLGLGHVVLLVPQLDAALDFWCGALGFRLSDFVAFGPSQGVWFLRCNARHHSVALVHVGPISGMHHVLFEVPCVDEVGRAHDRAQAGGHPITTSLGRHRNDAMFSFYVRSPAGFDVEVGCEGLLVDDATWTPNRFVEGDVWGHKGLTVEALESGSAAKRGPR